ncbi:hypothetical protein E2C01_087804 [Portunus trituberculatus]|uniref:Uncharacterized protein n=1 Tax=Portunus trituberculatus TaxID=210409 RepID=A0A5B7JCU4_PORTR|nr:hypothetical protein [Portunus trituberculatus]
MVQESLKDHSYSASSIRSTSAAEPQDVAVQIDVQIFCKTLADPSIQRLWSDLIEHS